ncbi:MAG: hypothetical protein AAF725_24810, partial [Acidobacteriota bacterium]
MRTALLRLLLLAPLALIAQAAWGQGVTSFSFRGQLVLEGQAVDTGGRPGLYDFEFRAFDAQDSQNQIGETAVRPGLPLVEGRFETRLDFGA